MSKRKPYLWTVTGLVATLAVISAWTGPTASERPQEAVQAQQVDWYAKIKTLPLPRH